MARILCIGDAMLDVVALIDSEIHYGSDTPAHITTHGGGAAANTATWIAHQGHQVFFVSRIGNDAAGSAILSELNAWQIEHKDMSHISGKTGVVVVIVDKTGQRTMFPDSGVNSGLGIDDLPSLENFDAAFLSGYSLFNRDSTAGVEAMIAAIKEAKIPLFFDPASVGTISHFDRERALTYLKQMDVLLPNEEEALFLTNQSEIERAIEELQTYCPVVVIKLGDRGAIAMKTGSEIITSTVNKIDPVDTTGAGDAFAAGFIPQWIASKDLADSMKAGNELARQCVAIIGARPSVNPQ
jgi:sugar/nucleoside kinase (ribokinase family)